MCLITASKTRKCSVSKYKTMHGFHEDGTKVPLCNIPTDSEYVTNRTETHHLSLK